MCGLENLGQENYIIRELKHRRFLGTDVNRKSRLLLFDVYFTLLIQKVKL